MDSKIKFYYKWFWFRKNWEHGNQNATALLLKILT